MRVQLGLPKTRTTQRSGGKERETIKQHRMLQGAMLCNPAGPIRQPLQMRQHTQHAFPVRLIGGVACTHFPGGAGRS